MNQCVRVTIIVEGTKESVHSFVKEQAKECALEGVVQPLSDTKVRIIACGIRDSIDTFIDALHTGVADNTLDTMEVEPFMKDRDYRGVFRVIE